MKTITMAGYYLEIWRQTTEGKKSHQEEKLLSLSKKKEYFWRVIKSKDICSFLNPLEYHVLTD